MSKIYSALAGLCLSVLALGVRPAVAQVTPPHRTCGTQEANDYQQQQLKKLIPGYDPTPRATTSPSALRVTATSYTLPVIVHVIHNGEAVGATNGTNISQAQIQSQIDVLNEDYQQLNADGSLVPTVFQPVRGNAMLQFVTAKVDPSGNPLAEPGIDRVDRNTKGWTAPPYTQAYVNSTIKPGTDWDPARYVNIWVMNLGSGLLGYAQFPDNPTGLGGLNPLGGTAATDGVVILYSAFGSRAKVPAGTYTTAYDRGRSLTHELGHWLGLRHIWGDAACGTDYCNDTPTQQTYNFGCPTFPHITCTNVIGDQSMNFMDYTDDACMYMFSGDQVSRIQAVMANTPRRTSLATSNVACLTTTAIAATTNASACQGSTINLTATGPAGASYVWTGPNGFTSSLQNPTITNATAAATGTYTVTATLPTGVCPGVASTNSAATSLMVNPNPPTPTLATTATIICLGTSATLGSSVVGAIAPLTYTWSVVSGNGLPAVTNTPTLVVSPTQASVYRLTVNYTGSTCTSSATVAVGVITAPAAPTITSSQSLLCGGGTATLTATNLPTTTGTTYKWEVVSGDGLPAATNVANITVTPTRTSSYKLTVTNSCGLSASSTVAVNVITNATQPYPVPFGDAGLTLQVSTCTPVSSLAVQMFDSMGRRVYDQTMSVPVGDNQILLSGSQTLSSGKYTLKLQQDGREITFNIVRL